jgi:hypothetical protein
MADHNGGDGAADNPKISQVVLTLDRESFTLSVTGESVNYDEALAIVKMGERWFKSKIAAAQMQAALNGPRVAASPFHFPGGRKQ